MIGGMRTWLVGGGGGMGVAEVERRDGGGKRKRAKGVRKRGG